MTYTHSFNGLAPFARFDGLPYARIHVEEAGTRDGTYTEIADLAIVPAVNPALPGPLYLVGADEPGVTITTATLAAGYFRVRYEDTAGTFSPYSQPIQSPSTGTSSGVPWKPVVTDLARLLPARAGGRFTGGGADGSPPSFPDEARVEFVIDMATSTVASRLGGQHLAEKHWPAATALAVLRTALTLEPAAWPEQARPDKSAWEQWKQLYDEDLEGLLETIAQDATDGDEGDGGPETAGFAGPVFSFPSACWGHIPGSELPHEACWDERW